jgi:hypothetical protein
MKINNTVSLTLIILFCSSTFLFANEETKKLDLRIIPTDEVSDTLSNTEVVVVDEIKDEIYVNRYYKDGSVSSIRDGKNLLGLWFIDKDGQHCIRWKQKDKSDCGIIMQDDEGNWVKVKKDKILKRYENIESLPPSTKKAN